MNMLIAHTHNDCSDGPAKTMAVIVCFASGAPAFGATSAEALICHLSNTNNTNSRNINRMFGSDKGMNGVI